MAYRDVFVSLEERLGRGSLLNRGETIRYLRDLTIFLHETVGLFLLAASSKPPRVSWLKSIMVSRGSAAGRPVRVCTLSSGAPGLRNL